MHGFDEAIPVLSDAVTPPVVLGTADLAHFAYSGNDPAAVMARIERLGASGVSRLYDSAIALQLAFRRAEGLDRLDAALAGSQLFRVRQTRETKIRLLALVSPGDLMANTPLDFLTMHADIRLDLLFVLPDQPLPPVIPDHDIAFFSATETTEAMAARLRALYAAWPRPVLNDPAFLPRLRRDVLCQQLVGIPGLRSPRTIAATRNELERHLLGHSTIPVPGAPGLFPCLIRPRGSHAGAGLARLATPHDLAAYLSRSSSQDFFLTAFEDYSGPDGLFRKLRVAFIDRQPFLCHMAVSSHWMVHYLNAGMEESDAKRAEEAHAMAKFDTDFVRRHVDTFDALHEHLGFDFYSIDCAETRDGRLLLFEADTAAIIHAMDPPDLFPYKPPQMQRVFAAFEARLHRHGSVRQPSRIPESAF
jgi:hypothetical protein